MNIPLTARERMYLMVIRGLQNHATKWKDDDGFTHLSHRVHVGDMVLCQTSQPHAWKIGKLEAKTSDGGIIVDPITGAKCNMQNEGFLALRNFRASTFYNEEEIAISSKIHKAFVRIEYGGHGHPRRGKLHRCREIKFEDGTAVITVGTHIFYHTEETPDFDVSLQVKRSDSIASIVKRLEAHGVGREQQSLNMEESHGDRN